MRRPGVLIALLLAVWVCAAQPASACRLLVRFPWLDHVQDAVVVLVEVTDARPVETTGFWTWDVDSRPIRTIDGPERSEPLHFRAITGSNGCERIPPSGIWMAYITPGGAVHALRLEDALRHDARLSFVRGR